MVSCAVRSCSSRHALDNKKTTKVSFHVFPQDPERRMIWIQFLKRGSWQPTRHSVICSKHFLPEYLDRTSPFMVRLQPYAIPTINEPILYNQTNTTPTVTQADTINQHNTIIPTNMLYILPNLIQEQRIEDSNVPILNEDNSQLNNEITVKSEPIDISEQNYHVPVINEENLNEFDYEVKPELVDVSELFINEKSIDCTNECKLEEEIKSEAPIQKEESIHCDDDDEIPEVLDCGTTTTMKDIKGLPAAYKYIQTLPGKYRANLWNASDLKDWMKEYIAITNTNWRVIISQEYTFHYVCRYVYYCRHGSYGRVEPHKNARGRSKNYNCPAKIKILIKHITEETREKDKYVKEGMPAIIEITNNHSHSLTAVESLKYLRSSTKIREEFHAYFARGLGIAKSINYYRSKLKNGPGGIELLNSSLNPKYRTVSHWYTNWKASNSKTNIDESKSSDTLIEEKETNEHNNLDPANDNNTEEEKRDSVITEAADSAEDFRNLNDLLMAKYKQFGASSGSIKTFSQRLKQVRTKADWDRFLRIAGSPHAQIFRKRPIKKANKASPIVSSKSNERFQER